jgi:dethiobiotin synthetase
MHVFITGTDTDVGKTLVSSWLCLHTGYEYYKPIQTGTIETKDKETVHLLSGAFCHESAYEFKAPLSPHLAAQKENSSIEFRKIKIPNSKNLLIEGAGGVLVPINHIQLMIDLMAHLRTPTLVVTSTKLGTINHTLLTLEALRSRKIEILGLITTGMDNQDTLDSLEYYGKVKVLRHLTNLKKINKTSLLEIELGNELKSIFD